MATNATAKKTWLITGCSTGLGCEAALARGDHVAATARKVDALADLKERGALTLALDVTSSDEILKEIVAQTVAAYGTIDILVNNAGYFLEGAVEECSAHEVMQQFNTNVFGIYKMLRDVLPYMRAQKSARWPAGAGSRTRGSTARPSYFRTSFLKSGNAVVVKNRIPDLEPTTAPIRALYDSKNGQQSGDPVKGAKLIVEALTKTGRCEAARSPRDSRSARTPSRSRTWCCSYVTKSWTPGPTSRRPRTLARPRKWDGLFSYKPKV